jgi:hypothetical protein
MYPVRVAPADSQKPCQSLQQPLLVVPNAVEFWKKLVKITVYKHQPAVVARRCGQRTIHTCTKVEGSQEKRVSRYKDATDENGVARRRDELPAVESL